MQPYFMPYIGYYQLIAAVDAFVFLDDVQYLSRHWMNRNRIIHPQRGWQYVTVPVEKHPRDARINQIAISAHTDWRRDIMNKIRVYKNQAPCFEKMSDWLEKQVEEEACLLVDLNIRFIESLCELLKLKVRFLRASELDMPFGCVLSAEQRLIEITRQVGGSVYINPPGGKKLYSSDVFENASILLQFIEPPNVHYPCGRFEFIENLSIIDVLMWNTLHTVREKVLEFRVQNA